MFRAQSAHHQEVSDANCTYAASGIVQMLHFMYFFLKKYVLSILNMLHTLRFSLQNAVYFITLHFLVPVLFTFYIQVVLKFKCKTPVPKG